MNLLQTCRTCLQLIHREPVLITPTIYEFLEQILLLQRIPREHEHIKLPVNTCFSCYKNIIHFKRFYLQCRDSEEFLLSKIIAAEKSISKTKKLHIDIEIHDNEDDIIEEDEFITTQAATEVLQQQQEQQKPNRIIAGNDCMFSEFSIPDDEEDADNGDKYAEEIIEYEIDDTPVEIVDDSENVSLTKADFENFEETSIISDGDIIKFENVIQLNRKPDKWRNSNIATIKYNLPHSESSTTMSTEMDQHFELDIWSEGDNSVEFIRKFFDCRFCDKRFTQISTLRSHEYIHSDARPHICEICGKAFRQKNVLVTHMALHTGKKIQCELCGKKFARKSQMILHNRMHRNEKPFLCDFPGCDATFRQRQYLNAHREVHSGVKKYPCFKCEKTFFNRPQMMSHVERVHSSYVFDCDMCDKFFKKAPMLREHMNIVHGVQILDVKHLRRCVDNNRISDKNNA